MRYCWAQYLFIAMVILLGSGAMLSGCGAKGDLYLPQQAGEPADTTTPQGE